MTVSGALMEISSIKPHKFEDAALVRWLSELDGKVWSDVFSHYRDEAEKPALPYDVNADMLTSLLIPFPHEDIYIKYLGAQIDFYMGEYARHNNDMLMFTEQYRTFVDDFTRNNTARPVHIQGIRGDVG